MLPGEVFRTGRLNAIVDGLDGHPVTCKACNIPYVTNDFNCGFSRGLSALAKPTLNY
jgi:hypothetical protein